MRRPATASPGAFVTGDPSYNLPEEPVTAISRLRGLVDHEVHLDRHDLFGLHLLTPSPCFSPATASPGGGTDAKEDLEQLPIHERNQSPIRASRRLRRLADRPTL